MNNSVLFKILGLIFFIACYFIAVIPAREAAMKKVKTETSKNIANTVKVFQEGERGIIVYKQGTPEKFKARISFGMNFFIGIIGLILISASNKFYLIEIAVQILFGALIIITFFSGIKGNIAMLRISNMTSVYFLPLSSLFMVVLAFMEKKSLKQKLAHES